MSEWSTEERRDAYRTAAAMAVAVHQRDSATVAHLWNSNENTPALLWALARLPVIVLEDIVRTDPGPVLEDIRDYWTEKHEFKSVAAPLEVADSDEEDLFPPPEWLGEDNEKGGQ